MEGEGEGGRRDCETACTGEGRGRRRKRGSDGGGKGKEGQVRRGCEWEMELGRWRPPVQHVTA